MVLLGAIAGLRAQAMIDLHWDGDTTWVSWVALRHASVVTRQRYAKGTERQVPAFVRELRRGA